MIKLSSNNVSQYLLNCGICPKEKLGLLEIELLESMKTDLESSSNIFVSIPSDFHLVVKQEYYPHSNGVNNKVLNEWQLHKFLQCCPSLGYSASFVLEILLFDHTNSILVYKYPKDYLNLRDYYLIHKSFPTKIAELLGVALANLHMETSENQECFNFLNIKNKEEKKYKFPCPLYLKDKIAPETFFISPSESIKFLKLYQSCESLSSVVTKLVANHNHCCLTNNSFGVDNILIPMHWEELLSKSGQSDKSLIKAINWDNCSWGDPAFDLGTVIASYFILWLNSLFLHPAIELEKSLQLAAIPLETIQPSVLALIKGYISKFPEILKNYPFFLERIVQFTGLALIYKVITMINSFKGFNNQGIIILQLAKKMLCAPEESFKYVFPNLNDSTLIH